MRESERERGRGSERGEREVTHIQGSNKPPTILHVCAASHPILVKSLPWTTRKADVRFLTSWPERERESSSRDSVRGQWLKTMLTSPSGSE